MNGLWENMGLTDRDLIEAVVGNFFILDYGFIAEVNPDKTINVTHAKRPKARNGESLPPLQTKNVEVLTLSGKGFSINFDYAKGDKVLLLGLRNFIGQVEDVTVATETTSYIHYTRDTMKALPLCVFSSEAKVKIEAEAGVLKTTAKTIELNGNSKQFVTWTELNTALQTFLGLLNAHTHTSAGAGAPTTPMVLDISAAKTTTIKTGG